MKKTITTVMEEETYLECKRRGIQIQYLITKGWESINDTNPIYGSIEDMKKKLRSMSLLIAAQQRSINDLRGNKDE